MDEIREFLDDWYSDKYSENKTYLKYKMKSNNGNDNNLNSLEEVEFADELDKFIKKIPKINEYCLAYIGGFDSCGYSIECYSLSLIIEGKLEVIAINFEGI